jgi:aminoglycoside phosphotransferase (APT) family kinase protein
LILRSPIEGELAKRQRIVPGGGTSGVVEGSEQKGGRMTDAVHETTPWRRHPGEIESGLIAWAHAFGNSGAKVTEVRMPDSGMSNDTVLFRLGGEALVARLAPAPRSYPTFPKYDLTFQQRVIELVRRRTSVPAPEIVHIESSEEWLGVPFMVVRAIDGVVPSDSPPYLLDPTGWFLQGTPEQWKRFETSTIEVLVQLHRVIDDGEETAFLHLMEPGDTALARQLASHRRYYEWARQGHTVPILERAFDVLEATMPPNTRHILNWGDARPGNIIYRDFEPVAVLDWEMAGVGPPEVDLAWTTFFQRFFAGFAEQYGLPPVPTMFDRAEAVATYEGLSGDTLDDLAWYEALAGLRFGIILTRMSQRSIAFGVKTMPEDPDDLVMFAPLLDRMLGDL